MWAAVEKVGLVMKRRICLVLLLGLAAVLQPSLAVGGAQTVVLTDIDGRTIRLSDYRGKWVLVNFWAYWCALCWPEMPALSRLNQLPDVVVIGISMDYGQDEAKARNAIGRHGLAFEAHVMGGSRRDPNAPFRQVGPVDFFPTSYLYAPDGEIVMFMPGQINFKKMESFMTAWQPQGGVVQVTRHDAAVGSKFVATLTQRYGETGRKAALAWMELVTGLGRASEEEKLSGVNRFFNQHIRVATDRAVWGQDDYWATPADVLGKGRGDSEDIAIAKYLTLTALNLPADRLRLVYAKREGQQAAAAAHMVIAYYPSPTEQPWVLDDAEGGMKRAFERKDLRPIFSFNAQELGGKVSNDPRGTGIARLPVLQDTLRRARKEGFD